MDERRFNYCLKNIHEEKCFTELYEFYYNRIVHHVKRKFNIGSLGEDVAQECFIKLLQMTSFKHIEFYTSWIYKISDNIALRKLEQEAMERKKINQEDNEYIVETQLELFGSLQESIEQLDDITQKIFYLHYVEAYTLKEIAEMVGLMYDNVRQKHHRGKKFLRKILKVSHKTILNVFL